MTDHIRVDHVVNLSRRRGFVFTSGEIYDARTCAWDYGPLGVELKENIKRQWWKANVIGREDVVGLDSAIALPAVVPQSHDPPRGLIDQSKPTDGLSVNEVDEWGSLRLRHETAQGAFLNFVKIMQSSRKKPPFGIGQVGKSFSADIDSGEFIFRGSEFEQMELAFFVAESSTNDWYEYWLNERLTWYRDLGISESQVRQCEPLEPEAARRATQHSDIEYRFGFLGQEFVGIETISNRGDSDLAIHSTRSGVELSYFDQMAGRRWMPHVMVTSAWLNRCLFAFLLNAYGEEEICTANGPIQKRVVLRLDYRLAPVKVAVLPISRNIDLSPRGRRLADALRRHWNVEFDDAGAIGRRYRRQDEIGTPYCVTVDFDTLHDEAVTIRQRDSMVQERVGLSHVERYFAQRLIGC